MLSRLKSPSAKLPQFIEPMHAKLGEAFDSDDYLFELKWDGMRTLAFIDHDAPEGVGLL